MSNGGERLLSYAVMVGGTGIPDDFTLSSVRVSRSTGAASHAQVVIDLGHDDHPSMFEIGSELEVSVGWDGELGEVFVGDIIAMSVSIRYGRKDLVIDAYDRSYRFGQSATPHVFVESSAADALRTIAGDCGLGADIDAALATPVFSYLPRVGTVHQFISDLATRAACEWRVDDSKLVVGPRDASASSALTLDKDAILSFMMRVTGATQVGTVEVRGWDPLTKAPIVGRATSSPASSTTTVATGQSSNTIGAKDAVIWPRTVVDTDDAGNLAAAARDRMETSALNGRITVRLTSAVKPGDVVEVTGVDEKWNGNYYVTAVDHAIDSGSEFTTFTVGSIEPGTLVDLLGRADQPSADSLYSGMTIGVVTNISDDLELGRVKVKLPYIDDAHETDFARVLQLGAGNKRGLQFLPEVDDEVVVAFENGDRRRPIVLGGLWNNGAKPPEGMQVGGEVERRALTSRLGHELLLRDGSAAAEQLVSITTAQKKAILVLAEDKISLTSDNKPITLTNGQSTITIDGGDIKIEAMNITVKAKNGAIKMDGMNIESKAEMNAKVEAGANLDLKGTAGATLQASGNTVVKGAMVQIN